MLSFVLLLAAYVLSVPVHALPTRPPQQITIQVGGNRTDPLGRDFFQTTLFEPNVALAANGTIVTFQFTGSPGNHSVTQSSFSNPCQPLAGGFDSGWISVPDTPSPPPEWNLTITNDQIPLWFYCKQLFPVPHCHTGMVGAINVETTNKSLPEFASLAAAAGVPSQVQNGVVGVGASATGLPFIPSGAQLVTGPPASGANSPASTTDSVASPTDSANSPDSTNTSPDSTADSGAIQTQDPNAPQSTQSTQPSSARPKTISWWTAAVCVVVFVAW
ncbi:hypothetical protein MSAN_01108400 [Mycena sanguinolenta]|uniref:Cupredoxin n=1 Tax=Mycena sanguinolenta TaxID=230812 RepID=A0A8H6YNQ1_9AGAR|nr:hypothetical protein MSAN_01108400 [Mycena sanguinolenta]